MTRRTMDTAQMPDMFSGEAPSPRRAHSIRFARFLPAPAILAVALLAAACSSNPSSPSSSASGLISQGLSAESSGQTQQALTDFNDAVAKNPTSPIAYYDLGVLYQQKLSEATQAATEYNKALLANPSYKPALFNLAILQTSSDPTGAISTYNKLLALNPNDPNVNFNLGLLLIAQNQPLQGHAALKKAISLDPTLAKRVPAGITP